MSWALLDDLKKLPALSDERLLQVMVELIVDKYPPAVLLSARDEAKRRGRVELIDEAILVASEG